MFTSVARRLALLNAIVVIAITAAVGGVTFVLLQESLQRQADQALRDRVETAAIAWADLIAAGQPFTSPAPAVNGASDSENDHDDESEELIESGDTLLFAFDRTGQLIGNPRAVATGDIPVQDGVLRALAGHDDIRTVDVGDKRARVYSRPVAAGGEIVGAIQAVRGLGQHEEERRYVLIASLIGIGFGIVFAVPAGLFLAGRAMRPVAAAFTRQRAFVADASHELRTPLALIRANVELVERLPDPSPEEVKTELSAILGEIDDLNRLVDDLLLLARLDEGAPIVQRAEIDLTSLVRETAETMRIRAEQHDLTLTVTADQALRVDADADRVRQILRILLDNAISYTAAGGSVTVVVESHAQRAIVSIRDTGVGIAEQDQVRVFDRFYRADLARSRRTGGTGLGLAIARALIAAHGGEIGLESAVGRGTRVWFALPQKRP